MWLIGLLLLVIYIINFRRKSPSGTKSDSVKDASFKDASPSELEKEYVENFKSSFST